jgi:hypothetical protein
MDEKFRIKKKCLLTELVNWSNDDWIKITDKYIKIGKVKIK